LDNTARVNELANVIAELEDPVQWLVCSVDKEESAWLEAQVSKLRPSDEFRLIAESDIELSSCVEDREALGRDRLLASWYAAVRPGYVMDAIVVDAGTAVTIDVVVAIKGHIGGLIFPGPHTCLSAVSSQTDALPDLTLKAVPELSDEVQVGTSTEPAILLGVHQLQLFGIVAIVQSLEKQYGHTSVHCCGGALEPVHHLLPDHWKYNQDLLIEAIFWLKRTLK
jgi:pantothenate kinase type III